MSSRIVASSGAACAVALLVLGMACEAGQGQFSSSSDGGAGVSGSGGSTGPSMSSDDDGDGFTEDQGDCNDGNPEIHPDAMEICADGVDNNCNGASDDSEPDADGDGFGPCNGDCDDADPNRSPSATEIDGDGIDNDCDGVIDGDFDGDGFTVTDGDCNDNEPDIYPGAVENCFDGIDNDCNGFTDGMEPDVDGDGFGPCNGDCLEGDPNVGPNQPEIPNNGIDDNCDNLVDEDIDGDGWTVLNGDCDDNNPAVNPAAFENCANGIDDNCDGDVDINCLGKCEIAEATRSSVGCTYYAIDADNHNSYDLLPFAVVVSNVDLVDTATVEAQINVGGVWTMQQTATVLPGALHTFNLPDRHIDNTGRFDRGAYRIVSDVPVIAYQFQPVDGQASFTSDASLLLPTSALDQFYYVVGWGNSSFHDAEIQIVATQDNTSIDVTPTVLTDPGPGLPSMNPGTMYNYVLNDGDFLQFEGPSGNNGAFTGTYITSDKPIMVLSSHLCANVPSVSDCCCDHMEEVMTGLQTWGTTYVASRMPVRNSGTPEPSQWQIFASENNTTVNITASPSVTGLPPTPLTMQQGDVLSLDVGGTFADPGDFLVDADKPIMVMEYMSSSFYTNAAPQDAGDPCQTQMVPAEQYLSSYLVLVPLNWVNDFLIITKPVGATVNLDGIAIPQGSFTPVGVAPMWEVARLATTDGVHSLDGTAPFGVIVVGYDEYDSYAYPGGLNQALINPIQ